VQRILGQNLTITLVSKSLSFIVAFYIIKILSKADYVIYNQLLVMLTFLPYFEIAVSRGFFISYPRSLHTKTKEESTGLFFNYVLFIIITYLLLGSFIFIENIPRSFSFCAIVFGQFLFTKFIEVAYTYYNSNLKMQQMLNIKYVIDIVTPLLTIGLVFIFQQAWSIFAAQTFVFGAVIVFLFYKNKIHLSNVKFNWNIFSGNIRSLFFAGFLIHITGWLDIALLNCDKIFMTSFVSDPESIANYCFAWNIANFIFIIGASIVGPYSQYLFRDLATQKFEEAKKLITKLNKQLIILISICLVGALICFPVLIGFKSYEKYHLSHFCFADLWQRRFCIYGDIQVLCECNENEPVDAGAGSDFIGDSVSGLPHLIFQWLSAVLFRHCLCGDTRLFFCGVVHESKKGYRYPDDSLMHPFHLFTT
jgi:O-antigen/teichoic acid export membrane protein